MDSAVRAEIDGHLIKADDKLRSAEVLEQAGQCDDAVSRAYYALFHAAKAVLLLDGIRVRTHAGLSNQLGLRVITPGRLDHRWSRVIAALRGERENGDYGLGSGFGAEDARDAIELARSFVAECRALIDRETGAAR